VREGEAAEHDARDEYQSLAIVYTSPYPVPMFLQHDMSPSIATAAMTDKDAAGIRA